MNPRIIASVAAVVGGAGWVTKAVLAKAGAGADLAGYAYLGGLVTLVVSLAAAGYLLAEKAPVWLRGVVAVGVPLLVLAVWQAVQDGVRAVAPFEGWLRDEVAVLAGGVLAVLLGLVGLRRARPGRAVQAVRGRRAAR